jgi:2-(1,2-epoxy-1,2-dihydrophenyl)acetyl-CoA isomerase
MTVLETGTDHLLGEVADGVAVLTLNRPERRNAFSGPMLDALARALDGLEEDSDVRCVVLTGAAGAFCAGGDVKAMAEQDATGGERVPLDEVIRRQRENQRATAGRLWSMTKPTIASIPGPAAGAGLALALACDLRYAAEGSVLTTAFARVGFSGDYGGTWFLSRLVGTAKAKELYFFSERVDATEAERLGIVNAVFPAAELEREVAKRAKQLAEGPAIAYRYMKETLNRAVNGDLWDCLDLEATHHVHTGTTEDHKEAARAFVDKRQPRFRGR